MAAASAYPRFLRALVELAGIDTTRAAKFADDVARHGVFYAADSLKSALEPFEVEAVRALFDAFAVACLMVAQTMEPDTYDEGGL